jgi:predicted transcriptional regulator
MQKRLKQIGAAEERSVNWIIKKAIEQYVDKWEARKKK